MRAAHRRPGPLGGGDGDPGRRLRTGLDRRRRPLLHARTGGWVAGIRLAALPLRDHPGPEHFLADFSGDERPVADYLADEVFSTVSAEEGDLLRRISIADPVPTGLAAELTGRTDAADLLADLERTTGLVVAAGGRTGPSSACTS